MKLLIPVVLCVAGFAQNAAVERGLVLRDGTYVIANGDSGGREIPNQPALDSATSFTVAVWVALDEKASSASMTLLSNSSWFLSRTGDGRFAVCRAGTDSCLYSQTRPARRALYHVGVRVRDLQAVSLFVNGKLETSQALTLAHSNGPWLIGHDATGNFLNGAILEVKFFNRALSDVELAELPRDTGICKSTDHHEHVHAEEPGTHHHHEHSHPHPRAEAHHHPFVNVDPNSIKWLCEP